MIIWFCLALVVTFLEMFLVTFYLLAVAAGFSAGGIAAYFECTTETQITAAGITTIIVACFSFMLRKKLRRTIDTKLNNMDKGERVHVEASKIAADGSAKVVYRGADWLAYSTKGPLTAGIYLIDHIDGTRLVLEEKVGDASQVSSTTNAASTENAEAADASSSDAVDSINNEGKDAADQVQITSDPNSQQKGQSSAKF